MFLTVFTREPFGSYSKTAEFFLLTPWSRVILEEIKIAQLVSIFPAIYATRRFINVFIRDPSGLYPKPREFFLITNSTESRGSSVGIATGYGLDDRGSRVSIPDGGWEFFSPPPRPDRFWSPPSLLSYGYGVGSLLGGKAAG
jgi:hypothetical protein